jgi:type VI secretion system secreted protein Hcp
MPSGAFDIFLKLDGIEGESTVRGHEKETVVFSYEQGIEQPSVRPGGGGGPVGRPTFPGLRFRKGPDTGSVPLMLACAAGAHIKDARFAFRRGPSNVEFYKVTLEEVLVARIVQQAGAGMQYPLSFNQLLAGTDNEGLLEEVTLEYARILWEYRPVGPDGAFGATVKGGWDLKQNKKI